MYYTTYSLCLVLLFFSAAALIHCGNNPVSSSGFESLSPTEKSLVASGNSFGFKLFPEIIRAQPDENVFISPLSASMALGMTYNGAANETQAAMEEALELQGLKIEEINASYQRVTDLLLRLDPKVQMNIANSIWYRQEFSFEDVFMNTNRTFFDATIDGMDFNNPATVDVINRWVSDKTSGRIEGIVDRIDPQSVMFLINAIYFKGDWSSKFDMDDTQDEPFFKPDGSSVTVQMMHQEERFDYFGNDTFQAIDLPYGNGEFRMMVLLPRLDTDINTLINSLNQAEWDTWTESFSNQLVNISLPRFKLEYERSLKDDLKALGMEIAFSGRADFTKMYSPGGLYISEVKQKTFVEVNEEGTEAAAVTSVEIGRTAAPRSVDMRVDRPFLFAIRERQAGTIIFIGKIVEPGA